MPAVPALKALPAVPHTVPMLPTVPAVPAVEAATFSGVGAPPGELPPASGVAADLSPASMVEEAGPLEPWQANVVKQAQTNPQLLAETGGGGSSAPSRVEAPRLPDVPIVAMVAVVTQITEPSVPIEDPAGAGAAPRRVEAPKVPALPREAQAPKVPALPTEPTLPTVPQRVPTEPLVPAVPAVDAARSCRPSSLDGGVGGSLGSPGAPAALAVVLSSAILFLPIDVTKIWRGRHRGYTGPRVPIVEQIVPRVPIVILPIVAVPPSCVEPPGPGEPTLAWTVPQAQRQPDGAAPRCGGAGPLGAEAKQDTQQGEPQQGGPPSWVEAPRLPLVPIVATVITVTHAPLPTVPTLAPPRFGASPEGAAAPSAVDAPLGCGAAPQLPSEPIVKTQPSEAHGMPLPTVPTVADPSLVPSPGAAAAGALLPPAPPADPALSAAERRPPPVFAVVGVFEDLPVDFLAMPKLQL